MPSRLISVQGLFRGLGFSLFAAVVTALFLADHGADALPVVYLLSAAAMPLLYLGYIVIEYRMPTGANVVGVLVLVSIVVGGSAGLAASASDGSGWMLYLPMVLLFVPFTYALLAEDVQLGMFYDLRALGEVTPRILITTTVGVVLAAVLVPAVSLVLPLAGLLALAVAAFVAMTAVAVLLVVNYASLFSTRPSLGDDRGAGALRTRPQNGAGFGELARDEFFRLTFAHHVLRQTSILLVHYLFLDLVARGFTDATSIASLLAAAMAAVQAVGVAVLLIAGLPLLFRYGLRFGLMVNPLLVSLAIFVLLAMTAFGDPSDRTRFWVITAAWSIERALSVAVTEPSITAGIRVQPERLRFVSLLAGEGLATPLAGAIAGATLLLVTRVFGSGEQSLLILVLVVTTAWGAASLLVAGGYRTTVIRRLQRPSLTGLDIPVDTAESHAAAQALLHGGPQKAALGLDMLASVGGVMYNDALLRLLNTADDDRTLLEVIDRVGAEGISDAVDGLKARLEAPNSTPVRVAAMSALVACEPHGGGATVEPLLSDEDHDIRVGAILAMLSGAVLRHHDVALGGLALMVHSNLAEKRRAAAMILGRTAPAGHRELLANLLTDRDIGVRAAAIEAIGRLNLSGHTPAVLDALEDPQTRQEAAGAVHAFGNGALPGATVTLGREDLSTMQAVRIVSVLAAKPTHGTTSLLAGHLASGDLPVRSAVAAGLVGNPYLDSSRLTLPERMNRLVRPVLTEEAARTSDVFEVVGAVPDRPEFAPLVRTVTELAEHHLTNVFNLLAVHYRRPELSRTKAQLNSGGPAAAMATELIDSVAGEQDRLLVASLLGRWRRAVPGVHGPGGDLPKVLSVCDDDWTAAAAIYGAALAGHDLGTILRPGGAIGPMQEQTLSWARRRVIAGATGAEPSATLKRNGRTLVMAIVEKVDVLRRCVLFTETSDRDLIDLAERSEQMTVGPGDSIQQIGQPADSLYVIVHGELEEVSADGVPTVRNAGAVIGALDVLRAGLATTEVMALRTVELLRLDATVLRAEIDQRPGMAGKIISALAGVVGEGVSPPVPDRGTETDPVSATSESTSDPIGSDDPDQAETADLDDVASLDDIAGLDGVSDIDDAAGPEAVSDSEDASDLDDVIDLAAGTDLDVAAEVRESDPVDDGDDADELSASTDLP